MTTDAEALVPMADLATEWGVTSNTVSRRLSFLGIKPIRQGNFRFLTAEQKALGDQLQDHVLSGKPMEAFPRPDGDSSQVVRRVSSQVTPQVAAQVEMAAAIAAALQPAPDPLRRAKGLAEAADHELVLTTDELVALGVKGVDGFASGDEVGQKVDAGRQVGFAAHLSGNGVSLFAATTIC